MIEIKKLIKQNSNVARNHSKLTNAQFATHVDSFGHENDRLFIFQDSQNSSLPDSNEFRVSHWQPNIRFSDEIFSGFDDTSGISFFVSCNFGTTSYNIFSNPVADYADQIQKMI